MTDITKKAIHTLGDKTKATQVIEVLKGMGLKEDNTLYLNKIIRYPYIIIYKGEINNACQNSSMIDDREIISFETFMADYGGDKKGEETLKPTAMSDKKLMEAIKHLLPLIYYSQIHTVTGVRPAGFYSHEDAWRKAQQFVWNNCEVKNGEYFLKGTAAPDISAPVNTPIAYKHKTKGWVAKRDKVSDQIYWFIDEDVKFNVPRELIEDSGDWEPLKEEPKEDKKLSCNVCGGDLVWIRGRYPGQLKRLTCPTCNHERIEQIHDISNKDYGHAATNL